MPVPAATVSVVAGFGAGNSARTDTDGGYVVPGVKGLVTLEFSGDGYVTSRREMTIERNESLDVELAPVVPAVNIEGRWRVTFQASETCAGLPPIVRTRRYEAAVIQQGAAIVVEFSGAELSGLTSFDGTVRADTVNIVVYDWDYVGLVERVEDHRYVALSGIISARAITTGISGTFDGWVYLGETAEKPFTQENCESTDHRITFVRR